MHSDFVLMCQDPPLCSQPVLSCFFYPKINKIHLSLNAFLPNHSFAKCFSFGPEAELIQPKLCGPEAIVETSGIGLGFHSDFWHKL